MRITRLTVPSPAAILVLAASASEKGPGPLVTHFVGNRKLHILVTVVPPAMTDAEIVAVA